MNRKLVAKRLKAIALRIDPEETDTKEIDPIQEELNKLGERLYFSHYPTEEEAKIFLNSDKDKLNFLQKKLEENPDKFYEWANSLSDENEDLSFKFFKEESRAKIDCDAEGKEFLKEFKEDSEDLFDLCDMENPLEEISADPIAKSLMDEIKHQRWYAPYSSEKDFLTWLGFASRAFMGLWENEISGKKFILKTKEYEWGEGPTINYSGYNHLSELAFTNDSSQKVLSILFENIDSLNF